jgi:hypothetical protein
MFKQRRLTVLADTKFDTPATLKFDMPAGMMKLITVEFPSGCHDWVYLAVLQGNTWILPDEENEGIVGNYVTLQIPVSHVIVSGKNELTLRGWSPGSAKSHTLAVGIAVLSELERSKEEEYLKEIMGDIDRIAKLFQV